MSLVAGQLAQRGTRIYYYNGSYWICIAENTTIKSFIYEQLRLNEREIKAQEELIHDNAS